MYEPKTRLPGQSGWISSAWIVTCGQCQKQEFVDGKPGAIERGYKKVNGKGWVCLTCQTGIQAAPKEKPNPIIFLVPGVQNMYNLARIVDQNVETYLKIGHRDITVSIVCKNEPRTLRKDWEVTIQLDELLNPDWTGCKSCDHRQIDHRFEAYECKITGCDCQCYIGPRKQEFT